MKTENLEQYREDDGYINIDTISELENVERLREDRGSSNREKDWYMLDDNEILLRTNLFSGENVLYTNYAELIVEELAKQVDLPCAHYDLIKYKGQDGVLSQNVATNNQSLVLLRSLLETFGRYDEGVREVNIDDAFMTFRQLLLLLHQLLLISLNFLKNMAYLLFFS